MIQADIPLFFLNLLAFNEVWLLFSLCFNLIFSLLLSKPFIHSWLVFLCFLHIHDALYNSSFLFPSSILHIKPFVISFSAVYKWLFFPYYHDCFVFFVTVLSFKMSHLLTHEIKKNSKSSWMNSWHLWLTTFLINWQSIIVYYLTVTHLIDESSLRFIPPLLPVTQSLRVEETRP